MFWRAAGSTVLANMQPPSFPRYGVSKRLFLAVGLLVSGFHLALTHGAELKDQSARRSKGATELWSLRPLAKPPVPTMGEDGPSSPIDAFVLARLAPHGVRLAPPADRRTLLRRLSFNLTGLPPSPEDVDRFVADTAPDAWERLVDRLLASPHYGERWARHWLDVVHYGDTHGFDKDKPRPHAWPYRDYVIRAFNADKPYGRFVREQIAGDVLAPESADGIEALGFIAAGPWDFVGHEELPETKIDGQIARHLDRDNMVANTLGTFASLTVHCAQCHDHKFDPIPQEDYYRLQAVFAAVDRTDRRYYQDMNLTRKQDALEARQRRLRREIEHLREEMLRQGGDTLRQAEAVVTAAEKRTKEAVPSEHGFHSHIESRPDMVKWVQIDLGREVPLSRIVLRAASDDFAGVGDGFGFPVRYRVEVSADEHFGESAPPALDATLSDQPNPRRSPVVVELRGRTARFVRVTATRLAHRQNDYIFALAELEVFDAEGVQITRGCRVDASDSIESPPRWSKANLVDGVFPSAAPLATSLEELIAARDEAEARLVSPEIRTRLRAARGELDQTRRELEALPPPQVAYIGAVRHGSGNFRGTGGQEGRPRPIHLLKRGSVLLPGAEAEPGALSCVKTLPARFELSDSDDESARRAALARWLTAPENPLPWRSIVNRVWQYHFGRGLVATPDDFGAMGGPPSHPELLDWLAADFRDHGQSLKRLHRLILTSAVYRQSSEATRETAARMTVIDPENRLLWRMNRRKLEAEIVRDSLLWVSGKLDATMYGPGFQDFIVEKPEHSPHYQYHLHDPEDLRTHRRSIYRFIVRSQQQPFMTALDCADPSMRVDRRNETLTPLQALTMLNNALSLSMAAHFAARVERETGSEPAAKIRHAFRLALQREPSADERAAVADYAARHGLANACRVIFNLNEFAFAD